MIMQNKTDINSQIRDNVRKKTYFQEKRRYYAENSRKELTRTNFGPEETEETKLMLKKKKLFEKIFLRDGLKKQTDQKDGIKILLKKTEVEDFNVSKNP